MGRRYMEEIVALKGPETRKLKALAQKLEATLKVGKNGLSPTFVQSVEEELTRHELVKIRLVEFKEQRKTLGPELARATSSHLVALVGNVFVLYKRSPKLEKHVLGEVAPNAQPQAPSTQS